MATWDAAMEGNVRARPVRAFRCEEAEAQVERRRVALAVLLSTPQDIARALRAARREARMGARGYDPARHAALVRLWKAKGEEAGRAGRPGGAPDREGVPSAQSPSNRAVER